MPALIKWVRPPRPCRPSKLRLDVEAQRSPGSSRSAFIARHIEHPDSRHSNPAATKILSRPSFSACAFTNPEPGTTIAPTCDATLRPRAKFADTTSAASRKSSMRPLVHEPIKARSIRTSRKRVPGRRSIYSSARSMPLRLPASLSAAGSGTRPETGRACSGLVPHVTIGVMSAALIVTSTSNFAPSSDFNVFQ